MNIIAFACSPRPESNTKRLLEECLKGTATVPGARVETFKVAEMAIHPCIHCDYCLTHRGQCSISDEMNSLYPKVIEADGLILAAPIYFMSFCAQAKALIDRCQVFWADKSAANPCLIAPGRKRLALLIAVGATHGEKVFAGSKTTMKWFCDSLQMDYWGNLLANAVEQQNDMLKFPDKLQEAFTLGQNFALALQTMTPASKL